MDQEREVEKNYGINKFEELKSIYGKNKDTKIDNRYLICNSCLGYYKLKENESPEDFKECECGSTLEYHQNIKIHDNFDISNSEYKNANYSPETSFNTNYDKKEEIQQIVHLIKNDTEERKKILEKLYGSIKKQEMLLNNIKTEKIMEIRNNKWSLWDHIESREIENDNNDQKMIIDEMIKEENRLLSQVKDIRKGKSSHAKGLLNNSYGKLAVLIWIIVFLSILGIYAIK